MKRICFFLNLTILVISAHAQRMKYKELFPLLPAMSNQEQRIALKDYLASDLEHPHANFSLALLYERNYKSSDPLTQYEYVMANAQQAKLRFVKSKVLVTDKEVRKNDEYYIRNFPNYKDAKGNIDIPFAVVQTKLNNGYDSANIFISKIPAIYKSFTKSVNFYDKAVKIFSDINSRFLSEADLYLYYDADLDKQMYDLQKAYDSAKLHLDNYLSLIREYPIQKHKQQYQVKTIVTYRLDGLVTSVNFLTNTIELWDYATWAVEARKQVQTSIALLRTNLNQAEEKIDNVLAELEKNNMTVAPIKLEKPLVFTLNNYDKQSLALALLDYKSFKQNWLLQSKTFRPDTTFSDRNADAYSALIYTNRNADTLATTVNNRIVKVKYDKHKDFFTKYYGNEEAVQRYCSKEKETIEKTYKDYADGLRTQIIGLATHEQKLEQSKFIRSGKLNISLATTVATKELIDKGEPITLFSKKSPDGTTYLSGIYKTDKKSKFVSAFLTKINADGKTAAWLKTYDFKIDSLAKASDANNFPAAVELTREGSVVVVNTSDTLHVTPRNTFVYYDDKGMEKFKINLRETAYPRKLNYIEKTNSFLLALKGHAEKNDFNAAEDLTVLSLNALGDQQWSRAINVQGSFTDLINLANGSMVLGNFMVLKGLNGKEFRTKIAVKEVNPFMATIANNGDVTRILPIATPKSIVTLKAVKVSDNSINLLSLDGTFDLPENSTISPDEQFNHIMINQYGQKICASF